MSAISPTAKYVQTIERIKSDQNQTYLTSKHRLNFLLGTQFRLAREYTKELALNPQNITLRNQLDLLIADIKAMQISLLAFNPNGDPQDI
jgi:hypothetical protein